MSDLYLGVLLVLSVMTLIYFGPELGRYLRLRFFRSSGRRARFRRAMRVRSRKVNLTRSPVHP